MLIIRGVFIQEMEAESVKVREYKSLSREQLIERVRSLESQLETLSLSAERLSLLMENSSDYIMIADGDGNPILFNKAYAGTISTDVFWMVNISPKSSPSQCRVRASGISSFPLPP